MSTRNFFRTQCIEGLKIIVIIRPRYRDRDIPGDALSQDI